MKKWIFCILKVTKDIGTDPDADPHQDPYQNISRIRNTFKNSVQS